MEEPVASPLISLLTSHLCSSPPPYPPPAHIKIQHDHEAREHRPEGRDKSQPT